MAANPTLASYAVIRLANAQVLLLEEQACRPPTCLLPANACMAPNMHRAINIDYRYLIETTIVI